MNISRHPLANTGLFASLHKEGLTMEPVTMTIEGTKAATGLGVTSIYKLIKTSSIKALVGIAA